MLTKPGVVLLGLSRPLRKLLGRLEAAYPEFIITSTTGGDHRADWDAKIEEDRRRREREERNIAKMEEGRERTDAFDYR